ncbi:MAG: UDP-N-acetylglucosamine 2-epimerase (non-hydrolyzing) [Anaerolineaceae bacterium]|nr:UDP-N-acetylglucosamine 2-epimerase (non-hydrolyzing) [Anaerolineaceae bacterium]
MRVLSIFGTRPEAVKMAPVVKKLAATPGVDSRVCVTAQHREMLDQVLDLFELKPDVDLNLMRPGQSLAELTAAVFTHLDPVLLDLKPDWVLVQGDTTTVMAAALLAYYHQVRIGHVEAGLRTFDKWQPFPEEVNRRVAGVVADLHFAPTESNRQNLLREGVPGWRIAVTGNPVIDALQSILRLPPPVETQALLDRLGVHPGGCELILVSAHRRENFGKPIEGICAALKRLAETYADRLQFAYPVHRNPNIQQPVQRLLGGVPNIHLLPPLPYLPLVHLMRRSKLVLTDSGGIQEEATALGVPTLVLREVTERPEGVEAGVLKLVGSEPERIFSTAQRLLEEPQAYAAMANASNPFGDGHAAERIVQALLNYDEIESAHLQ